MYDCLDDRTTVLILAGNLAFAILFTTFVTPHIDAWVLEQESAQVQVQSK